MRTALRFVGNVCIDFITQCDTCSTEPRLHCAMQPGYAAVEPDAVGCIRACLEVVEESPTTPGIPFLTF